MKNLVATSWLLTLLSGCGTIDGHDYASNSAHVTHGVYRGVRTDWQRIAHPESDTGLAAPYYCLDMPFSLVADTLWLPLDATAGTQTTPATTHRDVSRDRRYGTDYIVGATYRTRKSLALQKVDNTLSLLAVDRVSDSQGVVGRGENFVGLVPAGTPLIVTRLDLEKSYGSAAFVQVWGRFADGQFSEAPVLLSGVSRTLLQDKMLAVVSTVDTNVLELVAKP